MGQGDQSNESAVEQAKDEQISGKSKSLLQQKMEANKLTTACRFYS